ncbi:MAG TPA: MOSC domain-containing protein [Tepidiformaceae bacterium]|nr:MOSC domain-containing protein [Tepidiformaceae bacterium]
MASTGRIFQISVSRGGVPKTRVPDAVVTESGITTDAQADRRAHGSLQQALCLFALERLAILRAEGHRVFAGSTGENVTTEGVDWETVVPGAQLRLGGVLIEVTDYASPCEKNARWFNGRNFNRIHQAVFPGWSRVYARVLEGGTIREGDPVVVLGDSAIERVVRRQAPVTRWPQDFR